MKIDFNVTDILPSRWWDLSGNRMYHWCSHFYYDSPWMFTVKMSTIY